MVSLTNYKESLGKEDFHKLSKKSIMVKMIEKMTKSLSCYILGGKLGGDVWMILIVTLEASKWRYIHSEEEMIRMHTLNKREKYKFIFESHNYSEKKKVKLVSVKFYDYAIVWWD